MTVGNSDNYTDWISTERWLKIRSKLKNIRTEEIENSLRKNNIHVILYGTDDYPARLARLQRFPYILYIRGKLQDAKLSLAIV